MRTQTCARTPDNNEIEIVREGGLEPIITSIATCARVLDPSQGGTFEGSERDYSSIEELAAQCSRALRNLSVNG